MTLKLYMTTTKTNNKIRQQQERIKLVLDNKRIQYEEIDLTNSAELRDRMRELAGIPDLVPPQLFNDDKYCGNFQAFDDAVDDGCLLQFLCLQ